MLKGFESNAKMFYEALFNGFDFVPFDSTVYDTFLQTQVTGTCSMSCYHFYFSYKLGTARYAEIKSIISLKILYTFFSQKNFSFLGESMLEKNNLERANDNLKTSKDNLQPSTKLELFRWNVHFFDWVIRLLFRWNDENFKMNSRKRREFRTVALEIHQKFQEKISRIPQRYLSHSVSFFEKEYFNLDLEFRKKDK